jgi:hypothetical protein
MSVVSNDPALWPDVNSYRVSSYFVVASFVGVTYDWALTFGQEVELVWRQRWSLMTVMYFGVRYLGIVHAGLYMLGSVPTISPTGNTGCWILFVIWNWTNVLAFAMLWAIIITRLYAMYEGSRKILIFLIVIFLAVNIFDAVIAVMTTMHSSAEEVILFGTYQCLIYYLEDMLLLNSLVWIVSTAWEVLTLCLAVWIAVKHFRELRQHPSGEDCFTVLMKTHMLYFASFVAVSCFQLIINFSPSMSAMEQSSPGLQTYNGLVQIFEVMQMFVLGPRLILGIREYHAKLVADSDAATGVTSIAFRERVHISTSSSV